MKSAVENLSDTLVKLTVEVPFDELKPSMDAAYKKVGQQVRIPGFRPGKVPAAVLDQRVGRAVVLEEAINSAIPGFYDDGDRARTSCSRWASPRSRSPSSTTANR